MLFTVHYVYLQTVTEVWQNVND